MAGPGYLEHPVALAVFGAGGAPLRNLSQNEIEPCDKILSQAARCSAGAMQTTIWQHISYLERQPKDSKGIT